MVVSPQKTLDGMRIVLNKKLLNNGFTVEHTQRVIELSFAIGQEMGLSPDELEDLHWGALLHDIGKIAVDPEILNRPGGLTSEEYRHVMTHLVVGCNIAKNMVNENVLEIISHHHDFYDGSGLNQTVAGEDIPLGARILALADAFDAMTSNRPYRDAISYKEALMEIKRCSSTQFAPAIVNTFLKMNLLPKPASQDAAAIPLR